MSEPRMRAEQQPWPGRIRWHRSFCFFMGADTKEARLLARFFALAEWTGRSVVLRFLIQLFDSLDARYGGHCHQ